MQSTNRLGIIVAAISIVSVLLVFGVIMGVRTLLTKQPEPTPTPPVTAVQPAATTQPEIADRDNDGLADNFEPIYRTDPNNPDTDGDGTSDGDELALLRDPLIPGPDDTLAGLTETGELDTTTYTGRYLALLPTAASREDILSRERIEAFIASEQGELLPTIDIATITTSDATGEVAISEYLAAISASHNAELTAVSSEDITEAFRQSQAGSSSQALTTVADQLTKNLAVLKAVEPPVEVLELHQTLLAASQALLTNVQLLENMRSDFIGGLIGAKSIEELGPTFQDIAEQIIALETKYNLE